MSKPATVEAKLLSAADRFLAEHAAAHAPGHAHQVRLDVLESAACRVGSHDLTAYRDAFGSAAVLSVAEAERAGERLLKVIADTPIPVAFALSALAREPLSTQHQRETGAYYTDFRLAQFLGALAAEGVDDGLPVIDPACGTGILLCGLTAALCGADRRKAAEWLSRRVQACDLSATALRGALLSLATFTDDLDALVQMRARWHCGDSLLRSPEAWRASAPSGYGRVIANPPWEKVKLSRLEFAQRAGSEAHYGAALALDDPEQYRERRAETQAYAAELAARYPLAAAGEIDLYAAFAELFGRLAAPSGAVSALLPASLIRSQSARPLREALLGQCSRLEVHILHNHAKFFGIDTRFKFLALHATRTARRTGASAICIGHPQATETRVIRQPVECIAAATLRRFRPDLSLPEIRSGAEWSLFRRAAEQGVTMEDPAGGWQAEFCREVDMTRDRPHFHTRPGPGRLPLVEGRMVHQHRFGVKAYQHGTGRKAIWTALEPGAARVAPQFWIEPSNLAAKALARASSSRAGFCDIAGQTNERSMMATIIPSGVVCGNKVPTVVFQDDPQGDKAMLWVCIVNSFAFDWLLRRVLTTTVNYFLLKSIPLPRITVDSLPGKWVIAIGRQLQELERAGASRDTAWQMAELRAQLDLLVLKAYGLDADDLRLMLTDFPALDRSQPPLAGEATSTITADYLLWRGWGDLGQDGARTLKRVKQAKRLGAVAYIPSQIDLNHDDQANLAEYAA